MVLASLLLLALTRAEVIDRFKAAPIVKVDGLVQVVADCPADFVLLLDMTRRKGLTLEDVIASYGLMSDHGVTPSLDAFRQYLLHEGAPQKPLPEPRASAEIESNAMEGLQELTLIMDGNTHYGYAGS